MPGDHVRRLRDRLVHVAPAQHLLGEDDPVFVQLGRVLLHGLARVGEGRELGAVSYTHLDVYKRQVIGRAAVLRHHGSARIGRGLDVGQLQNTVAQHRVMGCLLYTSRRA